LASINLVHACFYIRAQSKKLTPKKELKCLGDVHSSTSTYTCFHAGCGKKTPLPHHIRQRKTNQTQKANAHSAYLVVQQKLPHPHKERHQSRQKLKNKTAKMEKRAGLFSA
jgi:hypothetical protein